MIAGFAGIGYSIYMLGGKCSLVRRETVER